MNAACFLILLVNTTTMTAAVATTVANVATTVISVDGCRGSDPRSVAFHNEGEDAGLLWMLSMPLMPLTPWMPLTLWMAWTTWMPWMTMAAADGPSLVLG